MVVFMLGISVNTFADIGVSYACDAMSECGYSTDDDGTYDCDDYESFSSLFELDENGRMFTHTISTMQSTYYVKASRYDNTLDALILDVVSDAGNYYTYAFYKYENKVTAQKGSGYGSYIIRFRVKNVF